MRRVQVAVALVALALATSLWLASAPVLPPVPFDPPLGDAGRGAAVFAAAGCGSCHRSAGGDDPARLGGGMAFASDFGTFRAPNISPGPAGIVGWSVADLERALRHGVSPEGAHYYPAFPYTAYRNMTDGDVADLHAFLVTLPPDPTPSLEHDLAFPFGIRRGVGLWKRAFLQDGWVLAEAATAEIGRGRYLVEALAHCGECHTPRNFAGALDRARWLGGAPDPAERGTIPPLTPDRLAWSAADIAFYLETGFTPDYDSAGGHMVAVIENFATLPPQDRAAVAAYLKALPPGP
jgi:mono/diheme cytochrome c family protein